MIAIGLKYEYAQLINIDGGLRDANMVTAVVITCGFGHFATSWQRKFHHAM
jgi:hypothetical protein